MIDQMDRDSLSRQILALLNLEAGADVSRAVNMWELGERIGLDRNQTEDLVMELVGEELVEIRSLSGSIALTETGLARAAADAPSTAVTAPGLDEFADQIEAALTGLSLDERTRLDLEIDLKILRLQQERSEPAPAVVQSVLRMIERSLVTSSQPQAQSLLDNLSGLLDEA